jgi:hypothetical protein
LEQVGLAELEEQTDQKEATQHLDLCLPPKVVDTALQQTHRGEMAAAVEVVLGLLETRWLALVAESYLGEQMDLRQEETQM